MEVNELRRGVKRFRSFSIKIISIKDLHYSHFSHPTPFPVLLSVHVPGIDWAASVEQNTRLIEKESGSMLQIVVVTASKPENKHIAFDFQCIILLTDSI